jgi:hypothetical protein
MWRERIMLTFYFISVIFAIIAIDIFLNYTKKRHKKEKIPVREKDSILARLEIYAFSIIPFVNILLVAILIVKREEIYKRTVDRIKNNMEEQ